MLCLFFDGDALLGRRWLDVGTATPMALAGLGVAGQAGRAGHMCGVDALVELSREGREVIPVMISKKRLLVALAAAAGSALCVAGARKLRERHSLR